MRIHKEGFNSILIVFIFVLLVFLGYKIVVPFNILIVDLIIGTVLSTFLFFVIRFFRVPKRMINKVSNGIISPADGTIVQILEAFEDEFFQKEKILISIFMSPMNVHVNSYPIDGTVSYTKYHPGKHYVASLPKASKDNEHNSVVVRNSKGDEVLFRQIAGMVARRIVSYVKVGADAKQGEEMGIIKFGSRVDVFVPLDANINVKVGDKVKSKKSVIAYFD
jgi:phosphatidylserine decarboxylase